MAEPRPDYFGRAKYRGRVAAGYEKIRSGRPRWEREQTVVRQWVEALPPGSSVLDAPFGTGRFVPIYLERGLEVYGLDVSPHMIGQAREILGEPFERCGVGVADAERLPLVDAAVDYAISHRFLKWLPTLDLVERVMGEFARVARRQILVQVKIEGEGGPRRRGARRWWRQTRKTLVDGLLRQGGPRSVRHRDADLRAIFARRGLRVAKAFDPEGVGAGVRYYVLEPAVTDR